MKGRVERRGPTMEIEAGGMNNLTLTKLKPNEFKKIFLNSTRTTSETMGRCMVDVKQRGWTQS